jgi:cytochrome P450
MSGRPPVRDWATDFDHRDPRWIENPDPIWDELRRTCPVAHTERFAGAYFPSRYADVKAIAYDTEHFSSRSIIMGNFRPPGQLAPAGGSPPITSDPPFHHRARKLLLPAFTKTAVSKLEPATKAFCHSLIDAFEGQDVVDAAAGYAQHIPIRVIADLLGFPPELLRDIGRGVPTGISIHDVHQTDRERTGNQSAKGFGTGSQIELLRVGNK